MPASYFFSGGGEGGGELFSDLSNFVFSFFLAFPELLNLA
jgi:hypothetical protein